MTPPRRLRREPPANDVTLTRGRPFLRFLSLQEHVPRAHVGETTVNDPPLHVPLQIWGLGNLCAMYCNSRQNSLLCAPLLCNIHLNRYYVLIPGPLSGFETSSGPRANHIDPEHEVLLPYVICSVFERCLFCCRHRSARACYNYLGALVCTKTPTGNLGYGGS